MTWNWTMQTQHYDNTDKTPTSVHQSKTRTKSAHRHLGRGNSAETVQYNTGWPVSPHRSRSGQAGPETFEGRKRLLPLRNACPMPVTSSSPSFIQPINLPAMWIPCDGWASNSILILLNEFWSTLASPISPELFSEKAHLPVTSSYLGLLGY
jgi:hypothetical protein